MNWQCASYSFDVKMPIVMGILNVTPDSFSDGGEHNTHDAAIAHAKSMIEQGAKVIDVGGESTRPGSAEVSVAEELSRTVEVVRARNLLRFLLKKSLVWIPKNFRKLQLCVLMNRRLTENRL